MERCITTVYTRMAHKAEKQWMKKNYWSPKTDHKGEVESSNMLLEEPEEANAEGLKLTLENSILKLGLNIERKTGRHTCFTSILRKVGIEILKKKKKKKREKRVISYLSIYFFHFSQEL